MPLSVSTALEGQFSVGALTYYTELAANLASVDTRPSQSGKETLVSQNPVGVVAAIVPWNFPVTLALSKIGPAMAVAPW